MRAFLTIAFSVLAVSGIKAEEPPAVRKTQPGKAMTPHQIEVEGLAKKEFGKAFESIIHSQDADGRDTIEVTCHVALESASAAVMQKAIKNFTVAFYTAGFQSRFLSFVYQTRVPDGLGNDKLTALVNVYLQQGLVPQVNWKSPDKIKFHVLFRSTVNVVEFKAPWAQTAS